MIQNIGVQPERDLLLGRGYGGATGRTSELGQESFGEDLVGGTQPSRSLRRQLGRIITVQLN